jgi:hypothetical protein
MAVNTSSLSGFGTNCRITPLETSSFTSVPSSCTLTTLSAAESSAVKQSVQACCAAAILKMSIGGVVWLLPQAAASKGASEDPMLAALAATAAVTAVAGSAGLDSASATTFSWPDMCRMSAVNSAMADSCRHCLSDLGSETRASAPINGL